MKPTFKSLQRSKELHNKTIDYMKYKKNYQLLETQKQKVSNDIKRALLQYFNASESDWKNWHWQIKNRITDVDTLSTFIDLNVDDYKHIAYINKINRFAIVPYYLSLITTDDSPIKKQSVPSHLEVATTNGDDDPMDERNTNPSGSITRRYPDRLIINVTNVCAMYCRHCQRRRLIGENDTHTNTELLNESIEYIKNNPEIRDVLLTGGDTLLLPNHQLEFILQELRKISHVEIIRIGTRTPVTMPMRITDDLVSMLKKYHPIYLNTHFNHPDEITMDSKLACEKLVDAGINVGNQSVLLKGINDDPYIMTHLNQKLLQCRVRPYYIFHAKNVKGTTHFIPKLSDGIKIMEYMRGNTSGLAIPTYIMNAPFGNGKVPLLPDYIKRIDSKTYEIRTWENKTFVYTDE